MQLKTHGPQFLYGFANEIVMWGLQRKGPKRERERPKYSKTSGGSLGMTEIRTDWTHGWCGSMKCWGLIEVYSTLTGHLPKSYTEKVTKLALNLVYFKLSWIISRRFGLF